jgi:hypothetical protein
MLTATVVFPTPPLPEPIATMLATPGRGCGAGGIGVCPMRDSCFLLFLKFVAPEIPMDM